MPRSVRFMKLRYRFFRRLTGAEYPALRADEIAERCYHLARDGKSPTIASIKGGNS